MGITTLKELVDFATDTYGEKVAYRYLVSKEIVEKTYEALQQDMNAFGHMLNSQGMERSHIAIIGQTSYEYIAVYLGTVASGNVIVPIDRELSKEAVCELLQRADIKMLVYDAQYEEVAVLAQSICPGITHYMTMQPQVGGALCVNECLETNRGQSLDKDSQVDPEDLAAILYTSGTTGMSKGVMLSHRNLIHNVISTDMGLSNDEVTLSVLPIHHAFCFTCDILVGLYLGVTVCVNDSLMHLARNMKKFAPTIMLVVPMIVESLYYKLSEAAKSMPEVPKEMIAKGALGGRLHTIYSGGAYLNPKYIAAFKEFGINLLQGYGMTESAPRISSNFKGMCKEASVGKLVEGTEAKCVEGELWVRSDSVMMGYYKNPEATAETIEEGWLRTGDLGYVDDEGFIYITGRKKNLIILSNGENVSAEAIENRLQEDPLIAEVLVYGENNRITAEIYPNEEVMKQVGIMEGQQVQVALQRVIDQMNVGMPNSKRVHTLKVRQIAFEKTTSRKIKRQYAIK